MIPVAVLDPVPAYRHGIMAALAQAGFIPEEPPDLDAWAGLGKPRGLLATIAGHEDQATVVRLKNSDVTVVALVRTYAASVYLDILRAGAAAAVPWDSRPDVIVRALEAALDNFSFAPSEVVRHLLSEGGAPRERNGIKAAESAWLRKLANGSTVATLAQEVGYSEREMFRLLRDVYVRLGARNRTEALLKASKSGLLLDEDERALVT